MSNMNYETDTDRANERRAAIEFAGNFKLRQFKIGNHSSIDRALVNGTDVIVGFAEIKCHLDPDKDYRFGDARFNGGYLLKEKKFNAAMALNIATNCPIYLVVEFVDALVYLDMVRVKPEYGHELWRADRDDDTDRAAVRFAWPAFRVIRHPSTSPIASTTAIAAAS